jgi:cytochrome c oxidase subunit IV
VDHALSNALSVEDGVMRLGAVSIWAILVAATLASGFLALSGLSAKLAATAVILIAAVKIGLVIRHFMELKWVHKPFGPALSVWLIVSTSIVIGGYWAA